MEVTKVLSVQMGGLAGDSPVQRECAATFPKIVSSLTSNAGIVAAGRCLPGLYHVMSCAGAEEVWKWVYSDSNLSLLDHGSASHLAYWLIKLPDALIVIIAAVVLLTKGHLTAPTEDRGQKQTSESFGGVDGSCPKAGGSSETDSMLAALRRDVAEKQIELDLANTKNDSLSKQLATLEAQKQTELEKANMQIQVLSSKLASFEAKQQKDLEFASARIESLSGQLATLETELQQAMDQIAAQTQQLDKAARDCEMQALELETCELLLEEQRDHAQLIIKNAKKHGCPLDATGNMLSEYAKEALKGARPECLIAVTYEGTLSNPVGATVYVHDEEQSCTEILTAFAAPKRGIATASIEAVKEYARSKGDASLVLESVPNAVPFWKKIGFTEDSEQNPDDNLTIMFMPL